MSENMKNNSGKKIQISVKNVKKEEENNVNINELKHAENVSGE